MLHSGGDSRRLTSSDHGHRIPSRPESRRARRGELGPEPVYEVHEGRESVYEGREPVYEGREVCPRSRHTKQPIKTSSALTISTHDDVDEDLVSLSSDSTDGGGHRGHDGRPQVELGFTDLDGVLRWVIFTERPLGMKYSNKEPLRVADVFPNTQAWEQGVKPGWRLKFVEDEDVSMRRHEMVYQILCQHTYILPLV